MVLYTLAIKGSDWHLGTVSPCTQKASYVEINAGAAMEWGEGVAEWGEGWGVERGAEK